MVIWLDDREALPWPGTVPEHEVPGLIAAGGRLTPARLDEAYRKGLFPWYGPGQPVLWWSPDPRMVLPVAAFRLHRSLRKTLARFLATPGNTIRFDGDFRAVIKACAATPREGQDGTWIVPAMVHAYTVWHQTGRVHSVETWEGNRLVGGLYFVAIGRMVFGESMFSHRSEASKFALAALVAACRRRGVALIDCQQHTGHLASLGAREIPRADFLRHVAAAVQAPAPAAWGCTPEDWAGLDPRLAAAAPPV